MFVHVYRCVHTCLCMHICVVYMCMCIIKLVLLQLVGAMYVSTCECTYMCEFAEAHVDV